MCQLYLNQVCDLVHGEIMLIKHINSVKLKLLQSSPSSYSLD